MNNTKTFHQKLSLKIYAFNLGLLGAVVGVLCGMQLFQVYYGLPALVAIFISYFLVVLGRAYYEQLMIWELPFARISLKNNLILALLGSGILSGLYYFFRAPLGDWAIPVTVILSMKLIGKIRKLLWPQVPGVQLPEVLEAYSQKIQTYVWGMYGFFLIIALGTYKLMKLFGPQSFYYAFAAAVFAAIVFEQAYGFVKVYDIKFSLIALFSMSLTAAVFAAFGAGMVWYFMQVCGFSGKAATIIAVIELRLMLPISFLRSTPIFSRWSSDDDAE